MSVRFDPEIRATFRQERKRQQEAINLIASENYASRAVLAAQGSIFTNKYAEGYPGSRYYAGCGPTDAVERLACRRAQALYGAEYANVQPHSGAQANMAAYLTLLEPGDTVLAMSLAHGGHLTHGAPVNFSGKFYNFVHYGVDRDSEMIDYEALERLALETRPKLLVAGASAYPRIIDFQRFRAIADKVGAKLMVDMAHIAGLVAGGVHPSPVPYAQVVTSTTHKTLRGPRGGFILCQRELAGVIDAMVFPGTQSGPMVHVIAAKAVAIYEAMQTDFAAYPRAVVENARVLAEEFQALGLRSVSGGTDKHLVLVDLSSWGVNGKQAEETLEAAGIMVNRNSIPFDPLPPRLSSGMRVGTPAATSRGLGPTEIRYIANLIHGVLSQPHRKQVQRQVRREVRELCRSFPAPGVSF